MGIRGPRIPSVREDRDDNSKRRCEGWIMRGENYGRRCTKRTGHRGGCTYSAEDEYRRWAKR